MSQRQKVLRVVILTCCSVLYYQKVWTHWHIDRTHHDNIISCRPCTLLVGQSNLALSFIRHDSLAVCLAPACRFTSNEPLQGSAGRRPRLSSACCLAASIGMFLPPQINQPKWDINSPHSTDLNKANGLTMFQQVNEGSAQYVFLAQRTVIMRVLWSLAGLKGNSADFTLNSVNMLEEVL